MASWSWIVYSGFAFILFTGIEGCEIPAAVRGGFNDAGGAQVTLTATEMIVRGPEDMTFVCEGQRDGIFLFVMQQAGGEKYYTCVRPEVDAEGTVRTLGWYTAGSGAWDNDGAASCAATDPYIINTLTKA